MAGAEPSIWEGGAGNSVLWRQHQTLRFFPVSNLWKEVAFPSSHRGGDGEIRILHLERNGEG